MELLDTHLHLVHPDALRYPWIDPIPALHGAFTLPQYEEIVSPYPVRSALFMEVDVEESKYKNEAEFFFLLANDPVNKLGGVIASGRPEKPGFSEYLDSIEDPALKGIRRVFHTGDASVSQTPLFHDNIRELGKRALTFDICAFPTQHEAALELVDACPQTQFILDHCGIPNLSEPEQYEFWLSSIKKFAERSNVTAKLSGIVTTAPKDKLSLELISPYLNETLQAFGEDRLVWGSDWPVCTLTTTLPNWIDLFLTWAELLTESQKQKIGSENAKRIYKLS